MKKILLILGFLVFIGYSFVLAKRQKNDTLITIIEETKSLKSFKGLDGKEHYIMSSKNNNVIIYKEDVSQKDWFTLIAFVRNNKDEGYFHPKGKKAYIKVFLKKEEY